MTDIKRDGQFDRPRLSEDVEIGVTLPSAFVDGQGGRPGLDGNTVFTDIVGDPPSAIDDIFSGGVWLVARSWQGE